MQEFRLVTKVSAKWPKFGVLLGLELNELNAWDKQYRGDCSDCWNKVMDNWLTRGGSHNYPATWNGLYCLLNDLGLGNIAVELKKAVSGAVPGCVLHVPELKKLNLTHSLCYLIPVLCTIVLIIYIFL